MAKLNLPQVTLCCVDCTPRLPWALKALQHCVDQITFGDAILCSDGESLGGNQLPGCVRWVEIAPLRSVEAYSEFVLKNLADHVQTSHLLVIQWDGFVLHALAWDDAFLEWDYIGAPWPHVAEPCSVGNGGFSLRSTRLMQAVKAMDLVPGESEDISICITHRTALQAQGLRFAPTDLAGRFSVEDGALSDHVFGFHAPYHLPRILAPEETLALVQSMTPSILGGHYFGSLLRELTQVARERPQLRPALKAFEGLVRQGVDGLIGPASLTPQALGVCKALIRYGQLGPARQLLRQRRAANARGDAKLWLRLAVNALATSRR